MGGYMSKIQVLDVGVMKPFKVYMTQCYKQFMVGNVDGRKVKRWDISQWVVNAWEKISEETITNSWASIGYNSTVNYYTLFFLKYSLPI